MKQSTLVIIILFLVFGIALAGMLASGRKSQQPKDNLIELSRTERIGGQEDEHGCLIPAGYSWCEEKQKCLREWEEPCTNEKAFYFLRDLKETTEIAFSGIGVSELIWNNEEIAVTMESRVMNAIGIVEEQLVMVNTYFENNDFELNQTNTFTETDEIEMNKEGYTNGAGNLACIVTSGPTQYKELADSLNMAETDLFDIEINCSEIAN